MKIKEFISVTLLIAGSTIGVGMLAIPLITTSCGPVISFLVTFGVWIFMLLTGLLFLEATLWMHKDANVLSISKRFLNKKGQFVAGSTFIFLYYCLMVAYFAAGAPLLANFIETLFHISIKGWFTYGFFGLLFGFIVGVGLKFVDRVNYIFMMAIFISYLALVVVGSKSVSYERYAVHSWSKALYSIPILFSAFGYHNVIPSLTFHFKRNARLMRLSIFFGTLIPFIIYILWQYLIIGMIPQDVIEQTLSSGQPITEAFQKIAGTSWIPYMGKVFALFAIITSLLGVAFSMVDFLGDGLKMKRTGIDRLILCLLTFLPPFIISALDPSIFLLAISVAGGIGEAFLNGILPALLVWRGRYKKKVKSDYQLFGGRATLSVLLLIGFLVMLLELVYLTQKFI